MTSSIVDNLATGKRENLPAVGDVLRGRRARRRAGRRLRRGQARGGVPPRRPDGRAQVGRRPRLRRRGQRPGQSQPAGVLPPARRPQGDLRGHRRSHVRRSRLPARGRDPPGDADLALRGQQAHGRALPLHVLGQRRPGLHGAPLPQRLRTAPGSPRRSRCGGHLLTAVACGNAADHLRRRHQDPRLLLRGRHRRRERVWPSKRAAAASTTWAAASRSPTKRSSRRSGLPSAWT